MIGCILVKQSEFSHKDTTAKNTIIIGFAACSQGGGTNVEITTSKAGKVAVNLYDQTLPADKLVPSTQLTPLARTTDKSITDDGKGLYLVLVSKSGEGNVSLSSDRAKAGATVTVTATPTTDWKLAEIIVDGTALPQGASSALSN